MNGTPVPSPRPAQTRQQAGSAEPNGNKPRTAGAHHARPSLSKWRLVLPSTVWAAGAGARLRRTWTRLRAWALPIAGPLCFASISAALGFLVGALFVLVAGR